MPIYEFYCPDCNTIFNFFSVTPDTEARPACPKCKKDILRRKVSMFATLKHKGDEEPTPFDGMDEEKMEKAMEGLAGEMEGMEDSEDPRAMARFMKKFSQATGMEMGPKMEDFMHRLEAGEDPESLESEMGDAGPDDEDALKEFFKFKKEAARNKAKPKVDETLYFL